MTKITDSAAITETVVTNRTNYSEVVTNMTDSTKVVTDITNSDRTDSSEAITKTINEDINEYEERAAIVEAINEAINEYEESASIAITGEVYKKGDKESAVGVVTG